MLIHQFRRVRQSSPSSVFRSFECLLVFSLPVDGRRAIAGRSRIRERSFIVAIKVPFGDVPSRGHHNNEIITYVISARYSSYRLTFHAVENLRRRNKQQVRTVRCLAHFFRNPILARRFATFSQSFTVLNVS